LAQVNPVDDPPRAHNQKSSNFTCTPKSSHFVQKWYPRDEWQKLTTGFCRISKPQN
jgi:hypothetical protein